LELFQQRKGSSHDPPFLRLVGFTETPGIEGALAKRAEIDYGQLDEAGQKLVREMFTLCLIIPGEGAEDIRRRASRTKLMALGINEEESEARYTIACSRFFLKQFLAYSSS